MDATIFRSVAKTIQIRNVPDRLQRRLKARAAEARMTLPGYLLAELRKLAERPTRTELLARLKQHGDELVPSPADAIREARDRR